MPSSMILEYTNIVHRIILKWIITRDRVEYKRVDWIYLA
jgi:hypothetical protein